MADDSLISQADIDNLLAQLSMGDLGGAEPAEPAAPAQPAKTLTQWLIALLCPGMGQLHASLSADLIQVDPIDSFDSWTYTEDPATMLIEQYGKAEEEQTLFLMSSANLQQLALQHLEQDPASGTLPVTEPQMTAFGSALKAMVTHWNNTLASRYNAIPHKLAAPEVADYDKDFLPALCPWLTTGPFYEMTWSITGLSTGPIILYQLWQQAEADKLLGLANQSPPPAATTPEPKPHASAPPPVVAAAPVPVSSTQASATVAEPITVQPVQFSSLDQHTSLSGEANKNLDLVLDITLNLSVELGKTQLSIKEVLELTRGSVIELDRIAGEPVDLYANGKLIAKGEVVVIEDSFGLRITSISSPSDRLKGLT
jgi:flagellar motor switch protein FliN